MTKNIWKHKVCSLLVIHIVRQRVWIILERNVGRVVQMSECIETLLVLKSVLLVGVHLIHCGMKGVDPP